MCNLKNKFRYINSSLLKENSSIYIRLKALCGMFRSDSFVSEQEGKGEKTNNVKPFFFLAARVKT